MTDNPNEAPTLRDQIACQILWGLVIETPQRNRAEDVARDAYLYADAMLAARSQ